MTGAERIRVFAAENGCEFSENEPLSGYTTFKIGGPAALLLFPDSREMLISVLKACREADVTPFILGNGSNLLVSDDGLRGVTVCTEKMNCINISGNSIECEAGALLSRLCTEAQRASLTGLEFAYGIPGTVGGAVYMNAGAYGGEVGDIITSAVVCDRSGNVFEVSGEELGFSYRSSAVQSRDLIVLSAVFSLQKGDGERIKQEMNETLEKRKSKQPLNYPSAGSTFKRPEGHFAGALIEQCKLKGFCIGGAMVSEKHAGFVINKGGATAADVLSLIEYIQKTVLSETGVELETEVKYIKD